MEGGGGWGIYSLNRTRYIAWTQDTRSKGALKVYGNLKNCWKLIVNVMELMVSKCIEGNWTKFTTQKYLNFSSS